MRHAIATLFLFLLSASHAVAWNKAGHEVSGAIAFDVLSKEAPETIGKVVALLKQHPDFKTRFANKLAHVPEQDRERYLFMLAARWADDIRDESHYSRPEWHFVNLPYKPEGQPASVRTREPAEPNILTAFPEQYALLKSEKPDNQRAIALTWVFHLVGDAHQPLHAAALFTEQWPEGDRGGNLFWVKVSEESSAINLHQLWDGLIISTQRFASLKNKAVALRNRPPLTPDKLRELAETRFDKWVKSESFQLAKTVAYQDGSLKGGTDKDHAVVLPPGYTSKAKDIAERRIVLAGYRLAALLKNALR